VICCALIALFAAAPPSAAQARPHITIDGECTAFAWAPDGRIVYATRHVFPKGKFDIQRDDLWLLSPDGAKLKIFDGQKYGRGSGTFSYTVTSLRWSPDSKRLTAALRTSQLAGDRSGAVQEGRVLLLLHDDGHPIKVRKLISEIDGGLDGTWLAESGAMAYATAVSRTSPLLSLHLLREDSARSGDLFVGHEFSDIAWDARHNAAIAIERSGGNGPPRLTTLDLLQEGGRALATLDHYLGGLSLSPNGDRVAYFLDEQTLEIRDIAHPQQFAHVPVASGDIGWSSDGSHLLIKRGDPREAGDLISIITPSLAGNGDAPAESEPQLLLGDAKIRTFGISPDGKWIGITEAAKRNLSVYPISF
jgi:hypothetical protein